MSEQLWYVALLAGVIACLAMAFTNTHNVTVEVICVISEVTWVMFTAIMSSKARHYTAPAPAPGRSTQHEEVSNDEC